MEVLPQLVPLEDETQLEAAASGPSAAAASVRARHRLRVGVKHTDTGVRVTLESGKTSRRRTAAGRGRPRARSPPGLGYEEAGVAVERGYVKVDAYCQTSVPTISAVGDLIPTLQLAHVGFAEGILVAERIAGLDVRARSTTTACRG